MLGLVHRRSTLRPNETSVNDTMALKRIVDHLELHPHTSFSIDGLAQDFGMKRRALYDFLSICSTFEICRRGQNNTVEWCGFCNSRPILRTIRVECQREPIHRSLKDIFNYSLDASLQKIAVAVIKLFFVLQVKLLDLRKVSRLFAQKTIKYKTMLRKLYTVTGGLDLARIVHKTETASQIQFLVPLDIGVEPLEMKLSGILNTQEELDEQRKCEIRRREFDQICSEFEEAAKKHGFDKKIAVATAVPPIATFT
jgi:hypothetical protein